MFNSRFIKDYLIPPFLMGLLIFPILHWIDNKESIFDSLRFGLIFSILFAFFSYLSMSLGIKKIRPLFNKRFKRHKNLENFLKIGFEYLPDEEIYTSTYKGYETEIFYAYVEDEIFHSRYVIVMKFEHIPDSKLKKLKIGKKFANSRIYNDYLCGYHKFVFKPPSTKDIIKDIEKFYSYLVNNKISVDSSNPLVN